MKMTGRKMGILAGVLLFMVTGINGQPKYDGDELLSFLSKPADSWELTNLKNGYKMEMANEAHYLSKDGIELLFAEGRLNQIQLYRNSAVYGNFTGELPHGVKFGMKSAVVKTLLGKPVVAYNSNGYMEFEHKGFVYSCWFEKGELNQVSVGLK